METQRPDGLSTLAWLAMAILGAAAIVPLVFVILVSWEMGGEPVAAEAAGWDAVLADDAAVLEGARLLTPGLA
ncbi:MAG: hypothetical protein GY778_16605, partial [bacterium]|nr:hypothetical protein [bacterium]